MLTSSRHSRNIGIGIALVFAARGAVVRLADMDQLDMTGRSFGRFQLLLEMSRGGMATLYLARVRGPQMFQKMVVIKKIHDHLADEQEFIEMFQDEARIAALIHHPNVATIFDMGEAGTSYYIAMEYVHGHNLAEVMRTAKRVHGSLPWTHVARIVADGAAGLHAAHELKNPDGRHLGVVHRDVSPQNLLISYDGHVKVVDFGIAYAAEKISHTTDGTIKGKVAYMSPEQASSAPLDRRSDVFSLGIVLFEACCMKRLFKADTDAGTLYRVLETVVPPPRSIRPDIPQGLEEIMLKALQKDPDDRYRTAGELAEALDRLLVAHGEVVSHQNVGELMVRYFDDQKKVKEEQIQQAMSSEPEKPMKAYGMNGAEVSGFPSGLETGSQIQQSLRRPVPFIALAGAGLAMALMLVIGVLLIAGVGDSSESQASEKPSPMTREERSFASKTAMEPARLAKQRPRPVAERPRKPRKVTLRILIRPVKARPVVHFRDKKHKGSPFEVDVKPSSEKERIEIDAEGFYPERLDLAPDKDKEVIVHLKPRPSRPRVRYYRRRGSRARRSRQRILKNLKDLPL